MRSCKPLRSTLDPRSKNENSVDCQSVESVSTLEVEDEYSPFGSTAPSFRRCYFCFRSFRSNLRSNFRVPENEIQSSQDCQLSRLRDNNFLFEKSEILILKVNSYLCRLYTENNSSTMVSFSMSDLKSYSVCLWNIASISIDILRFSKSLLNSKTTILCPTKSVLTISFTSTCQSYSFDSSQPTRKKPESFVDM